MALYSTYLVWFFTDRGFPVWLAILIAMGVSFVGGALIERIVIRPVEQSSPLVLVIVTIGMFLALNSITQVQYGADAKPLPRAYPSKTWLPGNVQISADTLVLVGVLVVECLLLYLLLQRTKLGLAVRGRLQPRVESAARDPRRNDADARLGARRGPRRARGRACGPGVAAGAERGVDAVDPRLRVRRGRARRVRLDTRRGGRRSHRRRRAIAHDAVRARAPRHRAGRAVRVDPARAARPAVGAVRQSAGRAL